MFSKARILKLILFLEDIFLLYFSLILALVLRHRTLNIIGVSDFYLLLWHFTLLFIFWLLILYILDFYELSFSNLQIFLRNFVTFLILALFLGISYFYFRVDIGVAPKTILLMTIGIFSVSLGASRLLLANFLRQKIKSNFSAQPIKVNLAQIDEQQFINKVNSTSKSYYLFKKITDISAALFGFLILGLLFLPIAFAIKLTSSGPIFYSQRRVGYKGRIFTIYKFRTMIEDAEKKGPQWAREKDPRVTLVGSILRRSHLDELPQAINLLKGEISLVGPRPERPEFVEVLIREIPHYHLRWQVKPGIMGWAQLNFPYGDSIDDAREKLEYDLYYILNRGWVLDLIIILKSFQIVIFAKGQ